MLLYELKWEYNLDEIIAGYECYIHDNCCDIIQTDGFPRASDLPGSWCHPSTGRRPSQAFYRCGKSNSL